MMYNICIAIVGIILFIAIVPGWLILATVVIVLIANIYTSREVERKRKEYFEELAAHKNQESTSTSLATNVQATNDKNDKTSFVNYADTCPDHNEDYGEEGSVIWGPRTIEENIYINGKWYINENSEEWEEDEE